MGKRILETSKPSLLATEQDAELPVEDLPLEAWCNSLSFVLRSSSCLAQVSAVSRTFRDVSGEMLSWRGASVCIGSKDLLENSQGQHRFVKLVPKWSYCERTFVNFQGCHTGSMRAAARQCLQMVASRCSEVSCLAVRNWLTFERQGLSALQSGFPKLRHLVLNGCEQISTYSALIPVFEQHPTLLSLRASFQPRAAAGADFASAAPRTLEALGFVKFENAETLAILLGRCSLEHLWFAESGIFATLDGPRTSERVDRLTPLVQSGLQHVRTLSLPSDMSEEDCAALVALCPKVELLCRMRIGLPAFGSGALAATFELVPDCGGVVVRRRGTSAELAVNGALWAPYAQDDGDIETRSPSAKAQALQKPAWKPRPDDSPSCSSMRALESQRALECQRQRDRPERSVRHLHEELAVAAAARRR